MFNLCFRTLEIAQVGPMTWSRTKKIVEELLNADDDISSPATDSGKTSEGIQDLDARCKSVFGALANTLEHLYKMDMKYTSCFRAAVLKKIPKDKHKELSGKPEVSRYLHKLALLYNNTIFCVTLLDFSDLQPEAIHVHNLENSVILFIVILLRIRKLPVSMRQKSVQNDDPKELRIATLMTKVQIGSRQRKQIIYI